MFTYKETELLPSRLVSKGTAFMLNQSIRVLSPAECTWDELARWVKSLARTGTLNSQPILGIFNHPVLGDCYESTLDDLVSWVASDLHEKGLSISDFPAYQWNPREEDPLNDDPEANEGHPGDPYEYGSSTC